VAFRCPPDLLAELTVIGEDEDRSTAQLIRMALRDFVDSRKGDTRRHKATPDDKRRRRATPSDKGRQKAPSGDAASRAHDNGPTGSSPEKVKTPVSDGAAAPPPSPIPGLVGEYVELHEHPPPATLRAQYGRQAKALLSEGYSTAEILEGTRALVAKGISPNALPSFVNGAVNRSRDGPGLFVVTNSQNPEDYGL
jgi:hypothetical protein